MPTSTPLSKESFIFETGDVDFIIRDPNSKESFIGKVSSSALILASPVWKKFLIPPWELSPPPPRKQIDCTGDDPEALLILLNVAHLRFNKVPPNLRYQLLYDVAVLVDQYQCIRLVQPWVKTWTRYKEDFNDYTEAGNEGWLFIAWVFGMVETFDWLARKLVRRIWIDEKGAYFCQDGKHLPEPMPPGIIESILKVRIKAIKELLDIPYKQTTIFETRVGTVCDKISDPERCDALVYGSLTLALSDAHLWPRKEPKDIHYSASQLVDIIRESASKILSDHSGHYEHSVGNYKHTKCGVLDCNFMGLIFPNLDSPVLDSHLVHMKLQRKEMNL